MNDFTEEELEDLHLIYRTFCTDDGTQAMRQLTNLETGILNKIQSMIDNYCEHSESEANHNYEVEKCKKCGRLFV